MRLMMLILVLALTVACGDGDGPTSIDTPSPIVPQLLSSSVEVIDRNDVFWTFSWKARVQANRAGSCLLTIDFFDAAGVELDEDVMFIQVTPTPQDFADRALIETALATRVTQFRISFSSCS